MSLGDQGLDFCVLYGDFPPTLYPDGNAQPDGSVAETFIETTDGDVFINHADYMFWGLAGRNEGRRSTEYDGYFRYHHVGR